MNLVRRANRRFFYRHPWQLLLTLVGIALGVAIMTGIDLSLESTRRAFDLSMDAVVGRTTHHILAGAGPLDESVYPRLRVEQGFRNIAPVVEGYATANGLTLHVMGIDPLAATAGEGRLQESARQWLARFLGTPGTVVVARTTAETMRLRAGDRLDLHVAGRKVTVTVLGAIEGEGAADPTLEGLILADISTAQEILDRVGRLDRIDVVLSGGAEAEARLRNALPAGCVLESAAGRKAAAARMTAAFATNLKALSTLALLVGMFIIYNAMTFNLLLRRRLLATLRVVGVTKKRILAELLIEAGGLGLVGALLGAAFALLAARGLLHLVTRTINDVYFVLTVSQFFVSPAVLVKGIVIGVAATIVAALAPALEAAGASPIAVQRASLLEQRTRRLVPWVALTGLGLLALAHGLLNRSGASLAQAIFGVFCLLLGYGLATPAMLAAVVDGAGWLATRRALPVERNRSRRTSASRPGLALPRLALRGLSGTLSRTGIAVAALSLSIAATIGTGVMVHSFRVAVAEWLDQILQADIYASLPSVPGRASETLPPRILDQARTLAGVAAISTGRRTFLKTSVGSSEALVLDPAYADRPGFRFKYEGAERIWRDFQTQDVVLVSEPYATRHRLEVGDRLTFFTGDGAVELPIRGIFFDYRSDQGIVVLHRRLYDRLWHDKAVSSLGLYLAPGADLSTFKEEVRQKLATDPPLIIRSNREIRSASLELFDRTFTVTQVLRLQALGVAFIGILSALLALQWERMRELATLRALGVTPGQIKALVLLQTGFLGLCAGLLALPLGYLVALALVRVINLRSFGWSMDLALPAEVLVEAVLLAVAAAVLAGIYPAWRAGRIPPATALREE